MASSSMRLDRTLTIAADTLSHWYQGDGSQPPRIPVLMYHSIQDQKTSRRPYFETSTPAAVFEQHLQILRQLGYQTIRLREALSATENRRQVVITFDDGCQSVYNAALPLLNQYGFTATVFVVSGAATDGRRIPNIEPFMTWAEIRTLADSDWEIGSHTVDHVALRSLHGDAIRYQLEHSKHMIEDALGTTVDTFAYPYAFPENDLAFKNAADKLLHELGYKAAVTTMIGRYSPGTTSPYRVPRLPINGFDDHALFSAKIRGSYDWMALVQRQYKHWIKDHTLRRSA